MMVQKRFNPHWMVAILLAIMALNAVLSLRVKSPTIDEFAHLPAGYYYWKTGDFSLYGKNPPLIRMLSALPLLSMDVSFDSSMSFSDKGDWRPWIFGTYFMRENAANYDTLFFIGRLPVVILGLLLGVYVFRWSRDMYGNNGGILSLVLYAFCPNILAHTRLVTTDMGFTCFAFIACYYYWCFWRFRTKRAMIQAGLFLGLALLSKFTALLLFPIFGLLLVVAAWSKDTDGGIQKDTNLPTPPADYPLSFLKRFGSGLIPLALSCVIAFFVVNVGYGFKGSFQPLDTLSHKSRLFEKLNFSPLNKMPIPLPAPFMEGFDRQKLDAEQGVFLNYLRGKISNQGWWYYFLYAFVVKTPAVLLLGLTVSLWVAFKLRRRRFDHAFVMVPVVVVLLVFSFFNEINVGLRYVLVVFPFLFVWLGQLVVLHGNHRKVRWATVAFLAAYVLSSLSAFPDYLAYFNLLAGGPKNGHTHLLDSNLDWGQDLKRLQTYMEQEETEEVGLAYFGHVDPTIYGISYHTIGQNEEPGVIAISANYLYGLPYVITYDTPPVPIQPGTFQWLHDYEPIHHIGHSMLIYSIPRTIRHVD